MPAPKPKPLGLSDSQFTQLINAADQLHRLDRDPFMRAVAKLFDCRGEIGDGKFARGLRELLHGGYFKPPSQRSEAHAFRPSKLNSGKPIA
jgi:hypothetical protein